MPDAPYSTRRCEGNQSKLALGESKNALNEASQLAVVNTYFPPPPIRIVMKQICVLQKIVELLNID